MKSFIKLSFILLGLFVFQGAFCSTSAPKKIIIYNQTSNPVTFRFVDRHQSAHCGAQFAGSSIAARTGRAEYTPSFCTLPLSVTFSRQNRNAMCTITTFNKDQSFKITGTGTGPIECSPK